MNKLLLALGLGTVVTIATPLCVIAHKTGADWVTVMDGKDEVKINRNNIAYIVDMRNQSRYADFYIYMIDGTVIYTDDNIM